MAEDTKKRAVELTIGGKPRSFDIDDPVLPDWVEDKKLSAGDFPYDKKMKREDYDAALEALPGLTSTGYAERVRQRLLEVLPTAHAERFQIAAV